MPSRRQGGLAHLWLEIQYVFDVPGHSLDHLFGRNLIGSVYWHAVGVRLAGIARAIAWLQVYVQTLAHIAVDGEDRVEDVYVGDFE